MLFRVPLIILLLMLGGGDALAEVCDKISPDRTPEPAGASELVPSRWRMATLIVLAVLAANGWSFPGYLVAGSGVALAVLAFVTGAPPPGDDVYRSAIREGCITPGSKWWGLTGALAYLGYFVALSALVRTLMRYWPRRSPRCGSYASKLGLI